MTASVKRLFSYLLAYKSTIAIAVVAMLLSAATSSLIALLLGKLTDMGFYEKNPVVMWWAPAALVGIALVHGGATFTSSYLLQKISQSVLVQLRESMFRNVISWPARTYQRYTSGAVISKFVNEASNALGTAAEMVSTIVRDSLQIVALSCVLVYQNWKLTLVALIVGPLMALLLKWVTKRMRQYTTGFQQTLGDMTGIVQEAYEGQRIIKIYDGYETELARFSEVNERIRKFSLRAAKVSNAGTPLAQFITMSAVSIVVVVALAQAQAGILTMGEFITYLSALLLLMPPIRHLSALNGALARLSAAAESVFALMDEVAEESRSAKEFSRVQGNVRFEHVSLCYDETQKPALEDFTLDVKAGETIAPYKFVRFLRNTRDGIKGEALLRESSLPIAAAYQSLLFEKNLLKKGGNKRGFLKSGRGLDEKAMRNLKDAFARLYSNTDSEGVIVLNNGVEFQESSATAVEMQLNELKKSNADELSKLLHISTEAMSGKASADDIASIARVVAIPLMRAIECALNRDLLLEREKPDHYWAFDTKELLKGDMLSRYQAYQIAVNGNWMGIDEVRYAEDMPKLGLHWIKLGLQDVLYDPKTKTVYTPNTNQVKTLTAAAGGEGNEGGAAE